MMWPVEDIAAECSMCHEVFIVTVDKEQYTRWKAGEGHIQNMLPELTANQRELLLSGTCGRCFDKLFSEDEEEQ